MSGPTALDKALDVLAGYVVDQHIVANARLELRGLRQERDLLTRALDHAARHIERR